MLHEKLLTNHPSLPLEVLISEINELDSSKALCDGTVSRYDRPNCSKLRMIATPKDIYRFLGAKLSAMNPRIS